MTGGGHSGSVRRMTGGWEGEKGGRKREENGREEKRRGEGGKGGKQQVTIMFHSRNINRSLKLVVNSLEGEDCNTEHMF